MRKQKDDTTENCGILLQTKQHTWDVNGQKPDTADLLPKLFSLSESSSQMLKPKIWKSLDMPTPPVFRIKLPSKFSPLPYSGFHF